MSYCVLTAVERCRWLLVVAAAAALSSGMLRADVVITRLSNQGVIISDGLETQIMIDGLVVEPYSIYGGLPEGLHEQFSQAAGPFAGIDLALVTHQHHEHNQPAYACTFMQKSTTTLLVTSSQVVDLMREKCRQFITASPRVKIISPRYDAPEVIHAGAATVTVFPLSHGVFKYAALENFGHLVEIGGMRVLHLGDASMDAADFERAGVAQMKADIVLIPFLYFSPAPGVSFIDRFLDAPHKIAVHIPPDEMEEVKAWLSTQFPGVLVMDSALDQIVFSLSESPSP